MFHEILKNQYFRLEHDTASHLFRLTRTSAPQTLDTLNVSLSQILAAGAPLRPGHILLDMRAAPGNNDPEFEKLALSALRRLREGFGVLAVLVESAVGRLHFHRISRESGQPVHVFFEEAEALRFLTEQPLHAS